MNWTSPGEHPSQGSKKVGGDETLDTEKQDMGLPPDRRFSVGGGLGGNGA